MRAFNVLVLNRFQKRLSRRQINRHQIGNTALSHGDDAPLTGATITAVRSLSGISLEDIAERTKISMYTLRCIEAEQHGDLPASVYLKGFLKQIAVMLRLDPNRLVSDYTERHAAWLRERDKKSPWRSRR